MGEGKHSLNRVLILENFLLDPSHVDCVIGNHHQSEQRTVCETLSLLLAKSKDGRSALF